MIPGDRQALFRVAHWTMTTNRKTLKTIRQLAETEENYLLIVRELDRVEAQLQRARTQGAEATLTLVDWLTTLDHFNWRCSYCESREFRVMSHFLSLPLGGTTPENCVPACYTCGRLRRKENSRVSAYLAQVKSRDKNAEK